jgi:hypothetical protein
MERWMGERIAENELCVSQVIRQAFDKAGESLPGQAPYVIEAMVWGLGRDTAKWATNAIKQRLESQTADMLLWLPSNVMAFLFPCATSDRMDPDAINAEADSLRRQRPEEIASRLLENLYARMP